MRPAGFTGTSYTIAYNFRDDVPSNDTWGYGTSWQITPGVRAKLPAGWENRNMQLVLHARVIGNAPTQPELVAFHVW